MADDPFFHLSFAAPTKAGKSTLVNALATRMMERGMVKSVFVFAGSKRVAALIYTHPAFECYDFSDEALGMFLKDADKGVFGPSLVILDDVLGTNADKSKAVMELFSVGRNYQLSCFCLCQLPNFALTNLIKSNSDFILFADYNDTQLRYISAAIHTHPRMTFKDLQSWSDDNLKRYTFAVWSKKSKDLKVVKA
jgi:hypothetical protein